MLDSSRCGGAITLVGQPRGLTISVGCADPSLNIGVVELSPPFSSLIRYIVSFVIACIYWAPICMARVIGRV